jgi:serine phosphatase RsbU (regulator of sigma subunit)
MKTLQPELGIDDYLRKRLTPAEVSIPQLAGIDMYGSSIPAGKVGGDLVEYVNFQQLYDIDARIGRALKLSVDYLKHLPEGLLPRNLVDVHVEWMESKPDFGQADVAEYRKAKRSEQLRIAEDLQALHSTAGILLVDAQGHDIISAKIASTVHDTFQAFILSELDRHGKTTPDMFERINLRMAESVTPRNALGCDENDNWRENATMLYGEICPTGHFRFVDFGHPPPLVFSAEYGRFMDICKSCIVQFLPLGMTIPEDHPDRNRYLSMVPRAHRMDSSELSDIQLMNFGDILFLYTDGAYDGSDEQDRVQIEQVIREHQNEPAKAICNAILAHAVRHDECLRQHGEEDRVDDKTVFIIKRTQ